MANTKSAKKEIRKTKRKTSVNKYWKNTLKQALRALSNNIYKKDKENAQKTLNTVKSVVDKAAKNKVIHKNKAARVKSKLESKVKSL